MSDKVNGTVGFNESKGFGFIEQESVLMYSFILVLFKLRVLNH